MTELVAQTLHRIFHRTAAPATEFDKAVALRAANDRPRRPDFAETRPVVFRSEAFAEDLLQPLAA
ncbi:hypothetical protein [Piscinibacter gummiphilus]|uniref:Uncharacterized protein n=1 Tax=Piscinibacter gummiphilus TaxID=946333 RepID=A0ABZ0CWA7_9BURK|nr:hypothetical protein [Piscinibacter gummiphilus]WOB09258.1 hypothetical protein RXV79_04170 [Piscinibacter gummiphilus]